MLNIDDYILKVTNMKNISDGGSPAYSFDDGIVLIKYSIPIKYGEEARKNEELIAAEANKKRAKGVRTPAHIAIKREQDGENNICWVLQEKAMGRNFSFYSSYNNNAKEQLQLQEELLNAPESHYEKCISDLCELFNMGLELKAKNIFYDSGLEDGGFTFIDLLEYNGTPLDSNSIRDLLQLSKYVQFLYNTPMINSYDKRASTEDKEKSKQIRYKMIQKTFTAMEKVIPNFEKYRRWILRSYSNDILDFFEKNGIFVGNLNLNFDEYQEFNEILEIIINSSIEKIASGKYDFWQIMVNEIRIDLEMMGMDKAFLYHKSNNRVREEFDDDYDYISSCKRDLENIVYEMFCQRLSMISNNSDNLYIKNAKSELDKSIVRNKFTR